MAHPFDLYFRKHQHYPRLRFDNGVQRLTVEFAPGYVLIKTSQPFAGSVYITRSTWFKMLPMAARLTRKWPKHPDHDVPKAVHEDYLEDQIIRAEFRAQKRSRRSGLSEDRPRRRRRRHRPS